MLIRLTDQFVARSTIQRPHESAQQSQKTWADIVRTTPKQPIAAHTAPDSLCRMQLDTTMYGSAVVGDAATVVAELEMGMLPRSSVVLLTKVQLQKST